MARRSTAVEPDGTQTMIMGLAKERRLCTLRMKCLIISSATSKSAMTPSRIGRIASMLPGVRPSIILASLPTARTDFLPPRVVMVATTDGFVEDDAAALDIDQRVRGPQIDGHVARKRAKKTAEHA